MARGSSMEPGCPGETPGELELFAVSNERAFSQLSVLIFKNDVFDHIFKQRL